MAMSRKVLSGAFKKAEQLSNAELIERINQKKNDRRKHEAITAERRKLQWQARIAKRDAARHGVLNLIHRTFCRFEDELGSFDGTYGLLPRTRTLRDGSTIPTKKRMDLYFTAKSRLHGLKGDDLYRTCEEIKQAVQFANVSSRDFAVAAATIKGETI